MAGSKKYYYLKLKEDFYDTEEMKIMQAMPDGYLYSDVLLKLYLKSLKSEGRLMYRGVIPYTPNTIAALTNHQVGTVEKAIEIFQQLGLIEVLDNGAMYMLDIQNFIGQSSTEADRKREYRNLVNAEKSMLEEKRRGQMSQGNQDKCPDKRPDFGQMSDKCPDISPPEIRDQRLDLSINNIINTIAQSSGQQPSEPEADVEALLLNDGSEWRPTKALVAEYVRLYPNVDVKQQFNEMRSWCLSNPAKRKTKRGITRFVNNWLSKEQNKGPRKFDNRGYTQTAGQNYQPKPNTPKKYIPPEEKKGEGMPEELRDKLNGLF